MEADVRLGRCMSIRNKLRSKLVNLLASEKTQALQRSLPSPAASLVDVRMLYLSFSNSTIPTPICWPTTCRTWQPPTTSNCVTT